VPAAIRDKIIAALVELSASDEGRAILRDTGDLTGFAPVSDADYATVHDLLAATQRDLADLVPGAWRLVDRNRVSPGNLGPL
jgi:ABC-type phosphate/phosphonate transport system substrate-binding protein